MTYALNGGRAASHDEMLSWLCFIYCQQRIMSGLSQIVVQDLSATGEDIHCNILVSVTLARCIADVDGCEPHGHGPPQVHLLDFATGQ